MANKQSWRESEPDRPKVEVKHLIEASYGDFRILIDIASESFRLLNKSGKLVVEGCMYQLTSLASLINVAHGRYHEEVDV